MELFFSHKPQVVTEFMSGTIFATDFNALLYTPPELSFQQAASQFPRKESQEKIN